MIIVKYCGGLGNQMFQFAMQIALKSKYPEQSVKADITHYNLFQEHNGFELNTYFGIEFDYASLREIKEVYCGMTPKRNYLFLPNKLRDFIVHKLQWKINKLSEKLHPIVAEKKITEQNIFEMQQKLVSNNWYVMGMWQDIKYFEDYQEQIIDAFHINAKLERDDKKIAGELKEGKAIAIHVRGGDFLKGNTFNLCGMKYYENALKFLPSNLPLYIFTDDEMYCKKLFNGYLIKAIVTHGIDESIKDMYMMSKAKYLLISNSTFSFWSAFLNNDAEIIVCPLYATKHGKQYIKANFKQEWKIIENKI